MKINHITETYKAFNEDSYGITDNSVWVMDGASALNDTNVTDEINDVVWVVKWWTEYLNKTIGNLENSIFKVLEAGITELNSEFSKFVNIDKLSKLDRASAGIAIVRINKTKLECFVLGDVEIAIKLKNGNVELLTDTSIQSLDDQVMELMFANKNRKNEIEFNNFTSEELEVLRVNRMKMNTINGYPILEHEIEAIRNGIYQEYEIKEIEDVLMMTDGYSAIYNKYNYFSLIELMNVSKNKGVENVLTLLRKIEIADMDMKKYKRLKRNDDATAVVLSLESE